MTIEQDITRLRLLENNRRAGSPGAWYRNEWLSMKEATHHEARLLRALGRAGVTFAHPACRGSHLHAGSQP